VTKLKYLETTGTNQNYTKEEIEGRLNSEFLLLFSSKYFTFSFPVPKRIHSYNYICCFVWLSGLVCRPKGKLHHALTTI